MRTSLRTASTKLLNNYGDDIELTYEVTTGKVYNPTTDTYVGAKTVVTVQTKAVFSRYKKGTLNIENDDTIKRTAIVAYQDDLELLDTHWKINNNIIFSVEKLTVENGTVVYKLYVG